MLWGVQPELASREAAHTCYTETRTTEGWTHGPPDTS